MSLKKLSPQDVRSLQSSIQIRLVDVREPSEFAASRIPAAQSIPLGHLQTAVESWPRETPVVLYCQSGNRSGRALALLEGLGFTKAAHLEGGVSAWSAQGLPTEKTPGAPWSLERQVRFAVGVFVVLFTAGGLWVNPVLFYLNFLLAAGLIFSAVTNTCGLALVLAKLPWNRVSA